VFSPSFGVRWATSLHLLLDFLECLGDSSELFLTDLLQTTHLAFESGLVLVHALHLRRLVEELMRNVPELLGEDFLLLVQAFSKCTLDCSNLAFPGPIIITHFQRSGCEEELPVIGSTGTETDDPDKVVEDVNLLTETGLN